MDQQSVREKTEEMDLTDQVLVYPGADEVELTLLARMVNAMSGRHPKVFVKYAAEKARELVPLYEGAALADTLKYHILSAGYSRALRDIILAVTAPAGKMEEAEYQPSRQPGYYRERNIPELIEFIKKCIREGKVVSIADNAYANGGETSFVHLLDKNGLLLKLGGYAGWNTSANTIGTALAEAVDVFYFGYGSQHQDFLIERYLEDCGYCSVVRWQGKQITSGWNGLLSCGRRKRGSLRCHPKGPDGFRKKDSSFDRVRNHGHKDRAAVEKDV